MVPKQNNQNHQDETWWSHCIELTPSCSIWSPCAGPSPIVTRGRGWAAFLAESAPPSPSGAFGLSPWPWWGCRPTLKHKLTVVDTFTPPKAPRWDKTVIHNPELGRLMPPVGSLRVGRWAIEHVCVRAHCGATLLLLVEHRLAKSHKMWVKTLVLCLSLHSFTGKAPPDTVWPQGDGKVGWGEREKKEAAPAKRSCPLPSLDWRCRNCPQATWPTHTPTACSSPAPNTKEIRNKYRTNTWYIQTISKQIAATTPRPPGPLPPLRSTPLSTRRKAPTSRWHPQKLATCCRKAAQTLLPRDQKWPGHLGRWNKTPTHLREDSAPLKREKTNHQFNPAHLPP